MMSQNQRLVVDAVLSRYLVLQKLCLIEITVKSEWIRRSQSLALNVNDATILLTSCRDQCTKVNVSCLTEVAVPLIWYVKVDVLPCRKSILSMPSMPCLLSEKRYCQCLLSSCRKCCYRWCSNAALKINPLDAVDALSCLRKAIVVSKMLLPLIFQKWCLRSCRPVDLIRQSRCLAL